MKQPYFTRILEAPNQDLIAAFANSHAHLGFYADPRSRDVSPGSFAVAADELTRHVCARAQIADGMRVLDIGCGVGGTIASLNERHSGADLVGLNIDAAQLDVARSRVGPRATNRVSFIQGDGCQLPFADASFDALISIECVEHLPSRLLFFREARRVLRAGGRLCLTDHVPPGIALPCLAMLSVVLKSRLEAFYGDVNVWPCTPLGYRLLGRFTNLRRLQDEDMTSNTMPSYAALRNIFGDRDAKRATAALEWLCRSGMVRYRVLTFE